MKSIIRSSILLLALPFVVTAVALPDSRMMDFSGTWKNQRGSLLVLKKEKHDHYTGTFTTAVAQTKSCIGKPIPVNAVRNTNALSLNISMADCGSQAVLAMTGLMDEKASKKTIDMMTLTVFGGEESWTSRIVTHDTFEQMSK